MWKLVWSKIYSSNSREVLNLLIFLVKTTKFLVRTFIYFPLVHCRTILKDGRFKDRTFSTFTREKKLEVWIEQLDNNCCGHIRKSVFVSMCVCVCVSIELNNSSKSILYSRRVVWNSDYEGKLGPSVPKTIQIFDWHIE